MMFASSHPHRPGVACLAFLLAPVLIAGCSSGEYNRRLRETLDRLLQDTRRAQAVFPTASPIVDASGAQTGISLRLPAFVDASAKSLAATDSAAQPPFCKLPGLAYAYEIPFDGVPGYVYLASVKADQQDAETLAEEVRVEVAKAFSGSDWQQVPLTTFGGGTVTLKRISAAGPQLFGGQKEDGIFEVYLISSATHHVLVGWRASSSTNTAHSVFDKIAISMGTTQGGAG